ncbi:MAG TPA: TonB-dependent receptor [Thermoanaerobaculia bacterium]|nr:TonB-dependent receptor [Thermoanaerobaculia bacterium]
MKHALAVIPTLFLIAVSAVAQSQTPAVSEEIVVTASALPERVDDTPASVTVITHDHIETRAARDVSDVLREVPGVVVARIGSAGHQTSIFTRGSNPAHTLVMWNGIAINTPFFGGYDWGQFSTSGIEQIEIVRGPYSALYGSDAMAGVVNIRTVPTRSGFQASVEGGGRGLLNAQVAGSHVSRGPNGGLTLSGAFETRRDDGFADNDDFDQQSANVAFRWTSAAQFSVGLTGRYTTYDLGVPTNLNFTLDQLVPSLQRRQDGNERQIAIPIEQTLGSFSYELLLAENHREDTLDDPGDPFGPFFQTTDSRTRRARLTTRTKTSIGTIVAGAEGANTTVDDVTNFGPNFLGKEREERSLFIEDRYSRSIGASRVELSAGIRYDDYDEFGSETSPRIAAAWIAGRNKFHAAYGEAFRAPSVGELYSPFGGNTELRAELSRSIEAGIGHSFDRGGAVSLTLFQDRYRDLITNAGFTLANVGRARARGVEVSAQGPVTTNINGGFTYTYLDSEQLDSGLELLRRPRHSGSAFVSVRHGISELNVIVLRTGQRADILPILPFTRTTNDAHTTVDANVQLDLGRFTPYVKIENLTDVEYEEVRGYVSPSRRAVVGVRFTM